MDENVKNDAKQVMLVQNADDGRLQAVTGVDQDGNIQTADPTDQNVASLLNVNTQDSALEAFFKKFMEQAQNPVHTGIFVMTENALNKLIRIDFDPEILENYRIDPFCPINWRKKIGKRISNLAFNHADGAINFVWLGVDERIVEHFGQWLTFYPL